MSQKDLNGINNYESTFVGLNWLPDAVINLTLTFQILIKIAAVNALFRVSICERHKTHRSEALLNTTVRQFVYLKSRLSVFGKKNHKVGKGMEVQHF